MNILFLSRWYPQPADNGSKIRIANLLRSLSSRHKVTLLSFAGEAAESGPRQVPSLGEVDVCPIREFNPRSFRSALGFLSPTPRYLIDTHSEEMRELIRRKVRAAKFDLVIASQLSMASYCDAFRGIPAILEEVELAMFLPPEGRPYSWASMRQRLTWTKHRQYMARLLNRFRACTVVSDEERRLVAKAAPAYRPVHVIPNFVDLEDYPPPSVRPSGDALVFAGSLRYGPNRDAMDWFAKDVFPRIKARVPGVRLIITGEPGPLPGPEGPDIEYTGRVEDVRPVVAASRLSIAPIRQGGGTRLKILEAMALRSPIVATSKAVEGLAVCDGVHLRIADDSQDFARAVVTMLRQETYARELAGNAFSLLESQYESRAVTPRFLRLVELAAGSADLAPESGLTAA